MIKTLHLYISRDLAKVTLLALVACTFVMTVFAVMEPLRKEGLSSDQVVELFAYMMPVMLSLTLPVAALFATTIIYGRFSQDRELMACKASGISTVRIMVPALVLGALVTVATLILSNFVAPSLASRGEKAVRANVKEIVYHQLETKGHFKFRSFLVHADRADPRHDMLYGVVLANTRQRGDNKIEVQLVVAGRAALKIYERGGASYAQIRPERFSVWSSDNPSMGGGTRQDIYDLQLPSEVEDKPAFWSWGKLNAMLSDPWKQPQIQKDLDRIARDFRYRKLAHDVVAAIRAGKPYAQFKDADAEYVIRAGNAKVDSNGAAILTSGERDGRTIHAEVVKKPLDGRTEQIIRPEEIRVEAKWSQLQERSIASIRLLGSTKVYATDEPPSAGLTRLGWDIGPFDLPKSIMESTKGLEKASYETLANTEGDPAVAGELEYLREHRVRKLLGKIVAEMHSRVAYGVSCFLLVAIGAALGIVFRGGQVISAFALSVIPAALVIVLILAGKDLVVNPPPSVGASLGIGIIWSGDALLLGATAYLYLRLMRR